MNILVALLHEGRSSMAELLDTRSRELDSERVELADLLESGAVPVPPQVRDLQGSGSPQVRRALSDAYLPILEESSWERAVDRTRAEPPVHAHRWVTFVPLSPDRGVSLPDDDSPREELTAFVDLPDRTATLSIPLSGPPLVELTDGEHCALPSRGRCEPGCGSCSVREVLGPRSGLVCLCDHDG